MQKLKKTPHVALKVVAGSIDEVPNALMNTWYAIEYGWQYQLMHHDTKADRLNAYLPVMLTAWRDGGEDMKEYVLVATQPLKNGKNRYFFAKQ